MPSYEYRCGKCGRKFTTVQSIREHDARRVKCPRCGSRRVTQLVSTFYAQTSSKA